MELQKIQVTWKQSIRSHSTHRIERLNKNSSANTYETASNDITGVSTKILNKMESQKHYGKWKKQDLQLLYHMISFI